MSERLAHHDLCFGCGIANVFGLQLELERSEDGESVSGRFFVKQDHQGPPGHCHGGVMAAALDDAMALLLHARGELALTRSLSVDFRAPVPVGTFVWLDAAVESRSDDRVELSARAHLDEGGRPGKLAATGTASFKLVAGG